MDRLFKCLIKIFKNKGDKSVVNPFVFLKYVLILSRISVAEIASPKVNSEDFKTPSHLEIVYIKPQYKGH